MLVGLVVEHLILWAWGRYKIGAILKKDISYLTAKAKALEDAAKKLLPMVIVAMSLLSCNTTKVHKESTTITKDSSSKVSEKQSLTTDELSRVLRISGLDLTMIYQRPGRVFKEGDDTGDAHAIATAVDKCNCDTDKFAQKYRSAFKFDPIQGGNLAAVYIHIDKLTDSAKKDFTLTNTTYDSSGKGKITIAASTETKTSRPSWMAPLAGIGVVVVAVIVIWLVVKLRKVATAVAVSGVFLFASCSNKGSVLSTFNDTAYSIRDVPVFDTIKGVSGDYTLVRLPHNGPRPNWFVTYEPSQKWQWSYAWRRGDVWVPILGLGLLLGYFFGYYKPKSDSGDAKPSAALLLAVIIVCAGMMIGGPLDWARANTAQDIPKTQYDSLKNDPHALDSVINSRLIN